MQQAKEQNSITICRNVHTLDIRYTITYCACCPLAEQQCYVTKEVKIVKDLEVSTVI